MYNSKKFNGASRFKKTAAMFSAFALISAGLNTGVLAREGNMYQYSKLGYKVESNTNGFKLQNIESSIEGGNIRFRIKYSSDTNKNIIISTMNRNKLQSMVEFKDTLQKDKQFFEFSIPALNLKDANRLKLYTVNNLDKSVLDKILKDEMTTGIDIDLSKDIVTKATEVYKNINSVITDSNRVEYEEQSKNSHFKISDAGVVTKDGVKEFTIRYADNENGLFVFGSIKGGYVYIINNSIAKGNNSISFGIPEEHIDKEGITVMEAKSLEEREGEFYAACISANSPQAIVNGDILKNPYEKINNSNIKYENGSIVSPVLPYDDFFSLFTKLPLGHTASTGKGVNIGIIGTSLKYCDFTNYIARDSKTYIFKDINFEELKKNSINVVAIQDISHYKVKDIEAFVDKCILNGIAVTIEGDLSTKDDDIKLVNLLEKKGAITVGQINRQGNTYDYVYENGKEGSAAFNDKLKDININLFVPNTLDANSSNYKYSLYGATGAIALLNQDKKLSVSDLKKYMLEHSRNVWQSKSIDGSKYYSDDITTDNTTSQQIPKKDSNIFFFKQLDFEKLLGVKTTLPWNVNIYNLSEAWKLSKGDIDVAIIDQGFHPQNPFIKKNVAEAKKFGNEDWNGNFHGTSMAKSLLSIAPEAKLHLLLADTFSVKDYDSTNIIKAIDYCIEKKIPIISMSWAGFFADDKKLIDEIKKARNAGITVVWFHYPNPENEEGIIGSAFTYYADGDKLAAFDRFIEEDMYYPQEIQAGLSYTAPQVAGLCALLKAKNPDLTPAQIEKILKENSIKLSNGACIPDMYKALSAK